MDLSETDIPEDKQAFNFLGNWRGTVSRWDSSPENMLSQRDFVAILHECLGKLSEKFREVLMLKVAGELDTGTICKELDISTSNLWVMLYRARMQLRDCLETNWFRPEKKKKKK